MSWYVLAFSSIVFNAIVDSVRRVLLSGKNKIDYYSTAFLLSFVTTIALAVYAATTNFIMPPIQDFKLLFAVNIIAGIVGLLTSQAGLSLIGVSEYTILMTSRQIVTWLASITFLGIGLSLQQGVGSVIILLALVLAFSTKKVWQQNSPRGIFFTLLTAVIYGLAFLIDLLIYRKSDPTSYLLLGYGLTVIVLFICRPKVIRTLAFINFSKRGAGIIIIGVLSGLSSVLLFTALKKIDNAPLVSGLTQIQIIVSVVVGIIILRERANLKQKLIGAGLATIGAILIVS